MLKIYCTECGAPTEYSLNKPKFCSSCGKPFDKNIVVNPVQLQKPTITKFEKIKKSISTDEDHYDEEDDNYYEDNASVPNINKIDFEISDITHNKIKMRDVLPKRSEVTSSSSEEIAKPSKNNKLIKKKVKNQEFLNQFKAEAGTLRPSTRRTRKTSDG